MELLKTKKENDIIDIKLKDEAKELSITLAGNGDIYMSMSNGERIGKESNVYRWIDINKDDEDIYSVFDNLFEEIMSRRDEANDLIGDDYNIIWVSDDGIKELEDSLEITKYNDHYHLLFIRNNRYNTQYECKRKSSRNITIRLCTSGSRYGNFASHFMKMYSDLINIEKPKIYKK